VVEVVAVEVEAEGGMEYEIRRISSWVRQLLVHVSSNRHAAENASVGEDSTGGSVASLPSLAPSVDGLTLYLTAYDWTGEGSGEGLDVVSGEPHVSHVSQ
jgi:hypothetical protein